MTATGNGPWLAELVGGPHDGREVTVPPGRDHYHMPITAPVAYWPVVNAPERLSVEVYQLDLLPGGRPATMANGRLRFSYRGLVNL